MPLTVPERVEKRFRWIRESISLMYAHHQHPVPMATMIFLTARVLGAAIGANRGASFFEEYTPRLWAALREITDPQTAIEEYDLALLDGLMLGRNVAFHEHADGELGYVVEGLEGTPYSINIDKLVPEFLSGLGFYFERINEDSVALRVFRTAMTMRD